MTKRDPLIAHRVRRINGGFAFIEHRFLRDRFWHSLNHHQLLLYFFLVLVADRYGLSYYGFDKVCSILEISLDHFLDARNALIEKDLIAFDGQMFQVLSLPEKPVFKPPDLLKPGPEMSEKDPATIRRLILDSLGNRP
jgi:hypothetical protein